MNRKFFALSDEKQNAIINAGCKGFYKYGYKKASMSEIAFEAGISKALLFHYFRNKREYYLYLFDYAMQLTLQTAREEINTSETDFFEIFRQSSRIKSRLLMQYPYLSQFMMSAYYEEDGEVAGGLSQKAAALLSGSIRSILSRIDRGKFKNEVDIEHLVKIVIWCGEGYMKDQFYNKKPDIEKVEAGYGDVLGFFRQLCYREEFVKNSLSADEDKEI